jgi:hypothetical protein
VVQKNRPPKVIVDVGIKTLPKNVGEGEMTILAEATVIDDEIRVIRDVASILPIVGGARI